MFESDAVAELTQVMTHAAGETLTALAQFDPAVLGDATVRSTLCELEAIRRRLDATAIHFLAELHDRQATEQDAALGTSRWLAREGRLPASATKQRVHTAAQLRDLLPEVDAALREGRIGYDHARVYAEVTNHRNAQAMHAASTAFCELASHMTFARWCREVRAAATYADVDGNEPHPNRAQLHVSGTDGLLVFRGELTGDDAVVFEHAVNAKADELFHQYKAEKELFPDARVPGRAALRAMALVELCRQAQGVDLNSTKGPRPDMTVIAHTDTAPDDPANPTELDLADLLDPDHHHTCNHDHDQGWGGGDHDHDHDHDHDQDRGRRRRECRRPVVTTADGRRLDDATAALVLCSAIIRGLSVDPNGVPIAETDARHPNRSQRRALKYRDGSCTFPGCAATFDWTEAHHLQHWPAGPTALSNLVSLCRRHHGYVHRHGWTVTLGDDGWTRWTSPEGTTRWGQRHFQIRDGP